MISNCKGTLLKSKMTQSRGKGAFRPERPGAGREVDRRWTGAGREPHERWTGAAREWAGLEHQNATVSGIGAVHIQRGNHHISQSYRIYEQKLNLEA